MAAKKPDSAALDKAAGTATARIPVVALSCRPPRNKPNGRPDYLLGRYCLRS